METKEIKNLEHLKILTEGYLNILKTALQLFPLDELELLSHINQKLNRENTPNQ